MASRTSSISRSAPASSGPSEVGKFLWPYLKPHWRLLIAALVLSALPGVMMTFPSIMPKYLLDSILLPPDLATSERFLRLGQLLTVYVVGSVVFRMLSWHLGYRLFTRAREAVIFGLRRDFFRQINSLCMRFHLRHSSGEFHSYLFGSPLIQVQEYFNQLCTMGPLSLVMLATTLTWVLSWDWVLTVVLALCVAVHFKLMVVARTRARSIHEDFQRTESGVGGRVADLLRGNRTIKLHALEDEVMSRFQDDVGAIGERSARRDVRMHFELMKQESAGYAGFVILCTCGVWRCLTGHLTGGELVAALATFGLLQNPLQVLFRISTAQGAAMASLGRIRAVLSEQSTVPEPTEAPPHPPAAGAIAFDHVTFTYDQTPALRDVSLHVPYGTRVALVGPSGSGKSTLVQLLLRFYDPQSGSIHLADVDLRAYRSADLRRVFGVVPQDPYLFQTTLRDNLRLLRPTADDDTILAACRMANATEFIAKLPAGLDTVVGEAGVNFSGGQRQRLAIARCLLAEPPFLIFDEATSALDTVSEHLIQQTLERVLPGRTAFFIAHRLATIRHCDLIVVMQEGRIVQQGSYNDLAARDGLFRELLHGAQSADPVPVG